MPRKYSFSLFSLFFLSLNLFAQNTQKEIWDLLLKNDRKASLIKAEKLSRKSIENLLIKEIVKNENGIFSVDDDFVTKMQDFQDFEYYLYAFWESNFLFQEYRTAGFNDENSKNIFAIKLNGIQEPLVKESMRYLKSVVYRDRKDWGKYEELNLEIPVLRKWQFCGSFENLNGGGLSTMYGPEELANSNNGFDANSNGKINWYRNSYFEKESYQFLSNHSEYGSSVNYAQTFVKNEEEREVVLRMGASSDFKVWLNDALLFEKEDNLENDIDAHAVSFNLPVGISRILIKLSDQTTVPYFIARLTDQKGNPINGITELTETKNYIKSSPSDLRPKEIVHPVEAFFTAKILSEPDNFLYKLALIKTYLRNSRYNQAKPIVNRLLEETPKSSFLRILLNVCYLLESDSTSANELQKNVIKDDKEYYLSYMYRLQNSNELFKMPISEFEEFVTGFRKATDYDILTITADLMLAIRREEKQQMEDLLDNMAENNLDYFSILRPFLQLYSSVLGKEEKEIAFYESYLNDNFNYSSTKKLASFYHKKGQKDKAKSLYEDLSEILSFDNSYLMDYADYLQKNKEYEGSIPYLKKALQNYPYSFKAMQRLGDAYYQMGKKDRALEYYRSSLHHNGGNSSVRKKIDDIENKEDLLKKFKTKDIYAFIEKNRRDETPNNYGYNFMLDEVVVELYPQGGGHSISRVIHEVTSKNGIENLKEYNLGLSGQYSITKSEIVKEDKSIKPATRSGSNMVFNDLKVGDVINIEYTTSWSTQGRFYKDYVDYFQVDSYHPSLNQNFVIITPKDHNLKYELVNGQLDFKTIDLNDKVAYQWRTEKDPLLPTQEDYMPGLGDVARYIHVSTIETWDEVATWYSDLVRPQMKINDEVKRVFKEIFPKPLSQYTEDQKASKIYHYIADNLSYSYVSFKQSGYVPQKPIKTLKSKLGDCKDFSTLFVVLANMANLKSHMVLVLTSDYGKKAMMLPNQDFNHCIVKVIIDGQEQFLELTDNSLPYRAIPPSLEYATLLEIPQPEFDNVKSGVYSLKEPRKVSSILEIDATINLEEDEQHIDIKTKVEGNISSSYRRLFKENEGEIIKKKLEEDFQSRIVANIKLDSIFQVSSDYWAPIFQFSSRLTMNEKLEQFGDARIFKVPFLSHPYGQVLTKYESREYPIEYVLYENVDTYSTTITIVPNKGESIVEIPKNVSLSYKGHSFTLEYRILPNGNLEIRNVTNTPLRRIEVEEYQDFKNYVTEFLNARKRMIGIKKIAG